MTEHEQKYAALAEIIEGQGWTLLGQLKINGKPAAEQMDWFRAMWEEDHNLNNITLEWWDTRHYAIRQRLKSLSPVLRKNIELINGAGWSLANTVSLLKEAVKRAIGVVQL